MSNTLKQPSINPWKNVQILGDLSVADDLTVQ